MNMKSNLSEFWNLIKTQLTFSYFISLCLKIINYSQPNDSYIQYV